MSSIRNKPAIWVIETKSCEGAAWQPAFCSLLWKDADATLTEQAKLGRTVRIVAYTREWYRP